MLVMCGINVEAHEPECLLPRGRLSKRAVCTYSIGRRVLLLSSNNATSSLSGVESGLATDDSLSLGSTGASLATDSGHVVPVIHDCGGVVEESVGKIGVKFDRRLCGKCC